jgi:hypothetical protein
VRRVGSMIILACHLRIIGRRLGPSVPCGSRAHFPRSVDNRPGSLLRNARPSLGAVRARSLAGLCFRNQFQSGVF